MKTSEKIKQLRLSKGLSQEALGDIVGVKKAAINKYETGRVVNIKRSTLQKLADALDVMPADLLDDDEATDANRQMGFSKGVSIPVLSTVVAGMPVDAYEDILGYEEITQELAATGTFFCLKVKGDSMSPVLQEGDMLVVRQQPDVESGDIAIVKIGDDTATVKKVQKQKSGILLVAFNQAVYESQFYTNEEIESLPVWIAGKVVEMKRSF